MSLNITRVLTISQDIIALLVQSGGGGIAAAGEDPDMIKLGSDIMLAGIVFQFGAYYECILSVII